ncbi:MAG TPA: alpha/beta hydrolase [Anaerolineales bacterium]|nr:alpha/beta hydrolase [Anaerolineales bacterium]
MPFRYRDEIKELNDETRRTADGSFIQLPDGVTHYELGGNESGAVVVLIHGFSVPYFIYDPTFKFLTESGFRVLRYDLFGRGFSDRPASRYNIDLFVNQLHTLLDGLRFTRPVSLIGLSLGGIIASTFAVHHPDRVNKLVLIDSAGARPISFTLMQRVAKLPLVAETILSLVRSGALIKSASKDFFDPALVDHFMSRYMVQLEYRGFRRAILSTIRHGMLGSFIGTYKALGKMDKRVMLLWGRDDMTVPFEHSFDLRAAMPNVEFHAFENSGHIPHYEKPDEVNPRLLKFLR